MNEKIDVNVKTLRPFTKLLMTIGELPTSYLMSMTYYEQIIWFTKYLQEQVIPAVNTNAQAVEEVQQIVMELQDYVNNYFDNLNVQEEINNKLDDMVEQGTLQEIIADYLNSKALFVYDTVADMKTSTNLIDGSYSKTLHYNSNDKGGAIYKIVDDDLTGNDMDIIELNNGLFAIYQYNEILNIQQFGAKGDNNTNNSSIFEYAFNNYSNVYIPNGTYIVNNTINFNSETQVKGESMTETIIKSSILTPLFVYKTEVKTGKWDIKSNLKFENLKVEVKNFMQINDDTLDSSAWVNQGSIIGGTFKNLWISGTYGNATDENKETNVIPTLSDLKEYGLGFNLSSVFDSRFENCRIEDFGLGMYLKGCDINVITNNRLNKNGVQIYLDRISSYGSQNTISNNDILKNQRYGAITINETRQDAIINNYFENYTNSACFIYSNKDLSTLIDGNRIDNPKIDDIDVMRLKPENGDIIVNNRIGPHSSYKIYINVTNENYKGTSYSERWLAIIKNNVDALLIRNYLLCLTDLYNPLRCSPYSLNMEVNYPDGQNWVSPWVVKNNTNDLYSFNNPSSGIIRINFKNLKKTYSKPVKLRIYYSSTDRTTLYSVVRCDGTDKRSDSDTIENDGAIHYYDIELADTGIYDWVRISINNYETMNIYAVELI